MDIRVARVVSDECFRSNESGRVRLTLDGAIHGIDELFRVLQLVEGARGYLSNALCGPRRWWFVYRRRYLCACAGAASGGGAGVSDVGVGVWCTGTGRRVDLHGVGGGFVTGRVSDFDVGG